jgi:putative hydrolase of the HAD superfamily
MDFIKNRKSYLQLYFYQMIKGIKHIIFDLGGVLLNLDHKRTQDAFADLGLMNFEEVWGNVKQSPLFDDFEVGKISREDFIASIRSISRIQASDGQIVEAWNALLRDFPIRRLQILQQLRIHYDLLLLSNTNELHEEAFNKILMNANGIPNIGVFFDKVYLSHRMGMRKPNPKIFERVLNENQLQPIHTLFIDDYLPNVEVANELGIQTIYLNNGMTIEKDIFLPK